MNLIELFESKPFQDVGTFNSIFYTTPILGENYALEVEIGEYTAQGRKVQVGAKVFYLDLNMSLVKTKALDNCNSVIQKTIYAALVRDGSITSVSKFARENGLQAFSAIAAAKELARKGIVTVSRGAKNSLKLVLTQ
jgi:hypothetical protein